ncbi:hypothetical protein [Acaryochloris sp. CCMEE 5410]|uniref:hypothetical protein n=1 Tax=Acaryochloris sp. CCMEE 5410 TaxID=310037 RepID=UPI0002483E4F|nr:hypothetical protein [Acaryochloris sp. CCMEE 5410]
MLLAVVSLQRKLKITVRLTSLGIIEAGYSFQKTQRFTEMINALQIIILRAVWPHCHRQEMQLRERSNYKTEVRREQRVLEILPRD